MNSGPPALARRVAGASFVLLVSALPALVAGTSVDAPPAPGERQRLVAAHEGPHGSLVADAFAVSTAPDPSSPWTDAVLAQARLAQLAGLLAASLLLYLIVAQVGGRLRAVLTCAALALLPPIVVEGHVLRPETPALALGLLAVLVLLGLAQPPRAERRRSTLVTIAVGGTAALAIAFAMSALPAAGILLLVPGAMATLFAAQLGMRLWRIMFRRTLLVLPLRASSARLWPWVFASVVGLLVAVPVVREAVPARAELVPTPTAVGLLPRPVWLRVLVLAVFALGAFRMVVRTGIHFGRGGRPDGNLLVLVYAAIVLLQHLLVAGSADALPATAAMAVVLGEGVVFAGLLLGLRWFARGDDAVASVPDQRA